MLDPRGRSGLMKVCNQLHEQGMTIIMITHFMEEVVHADRVLVLDDGHIALEGTPEEVLTQAQALESLSLDVPLAVKISLSLREAGMPVGVHVSEEALVDELAQLLGGQGGAA